MGTEGAKAAQYKHGVADRPSPFLFDLDGTLADTLADITASSNHVRAVFGLPPLAATTVRDFVGDGARALLRRALAELGDRGADAALDAACRHFLDHHAAQCTVAARLYPGVAAHLESLARRGHPLAIVTNKPERFARAIAAHLGIGDLLPVVIGGDTAAARKPEPAPLRLALERLGAGPAAGAMVGDGETDVRAGKAAGLRTIACLYGYRPAALLRREGPDRCWRAFGVEE